MTDRVSDEDNEQRYRASMNNVRKYFEDSHITEWWSVENTGWSGGISWFSTGGTSTWPRRFQTEEDAMKYALEKKQELNDANTLWRYVHTRLERTDNKIVTTEIWTEV